MLRPFEHFVPTPNLALYNGLDWPHVRRCLLTHADAAERIGAQASRFVHEQLTPRALDGYMRALLQRLSALQLHGGAIAEDDAGVRIAPRLAAPTSAAVAKCLWKYSSITSPATRASR